MAKPSPAARAFFDIEGPVAIAHRGGDGAGSSKRNTMAAFQSAYRLGYRYFETDVVRAKSGELIIAHGARIWLTAKLRGTFTVHKLQKLTANEIKQTLKVGGEPIPLLEEVIAAFPEIKFFVDPKTEAAVEPLGRFIKEKNLEGRIAVGSFYYHRTERIAEAVGWDKLCKVVIVDRLAGLLRLDLKLFRRFLRKTHLFSEFRVEAFSVPHWLVNKKIISEAHREGRKVIGWTVNSKKEIERMLDLGVDGIMSDHTELLKGLVLARNPNNQSIRQKT